MSRRAPKVRRLWTAQEWLTKARRERWWDKPPSTLERQAWEWFKRHSPKKPKSPPACWAEKVG